MGVMALGMNAFAFGAFALSGILYGMNDGITGAGAAVGVDVGVGIGGATVTPGRIMAVSSARDSGVDTFSGIEGKGVAAANGFMGFTFCVREGLA